MSKELEEAKLLSEKIDRLLAGEEVKPDTEMSSDARQALEFAREMKNMSNEPSPQFQARLKEKLLRQINNASVVKEPEPVWWEKLVRQPVWRTVTAVVVIAIISGVVWAAGFFHTDENMPITSDRNVSQAVPTTTTAMAPQMTTPPPSLKAAAGAAAPALESVATDGSFLRVDGSIDSPVYTSGIPVDITISIRNTSNQPVELTESPILSIMREDTMQPVFTFSAGQQVETLAPDNTVSYSWEWKQFDANDNLVPPGKYYIELEDLDLNGQMVQLSLSSPLEFEIKPIN